MSAKETPATGCSDLAPEPDALGVEEARARILARLRPIDTAERVPTEAALDRILAADLRATMNVPPHRNSAMDGIAVRGEDLGTGPPYRFREAGAALAGSGFRGTLAAGECVRITTGAVMPEGCDTVIIQEHLHRDDGTYVCERPVRRGQNTRQAGEDIAAGERVLPAGKRLLPAEIGLLASLGIGEVDVVRRLRVAVCSTGDEIRDLGTALESGAVYDSNRFTLRAMLQRLGAAVLDLGIVPDRPDAMREALDRAASMADVVISSGGVSVGEADYIKPALQQLGEMDFCKVLIRPGRPFTHGRIGGATFFGLPGNPVAVMVVFYQFLQPALRRLMGESPWAPPRFGARSLEPIRKRPGRGEFQRGILGYGRDGLPEVRKTGAQGSGILSSMSQANCFIVLEPERGDVAEGESVTVEPFFGLV